MPHTDMISSSASMFATVATIQDYSTRKRQKSGLLAPPFYRPTGLHPQLFTRNLFVSVVAYDSLAHAMSKYADDQSDEAEKELVEFETKRMNGRNPWDFQKLFMIVCNNSHHYVLALVQINTQTVTVPSENCTSRRSKTMVPSSKLQLTARVEVHDSGLNTTGVLSGAFSANRRMANAEILKNITKYLKWAATRMPERGGHTVYNVGKTVPPEGSVPQQNHQKLRLECGVFSILSAMK